MQFFAQSKDDLPVLAAAASMRTVQTTQMLLGAFDHASHEVRTSRYDSHRPKIVDECVRIM